MMRERVRSDPDRRRVGGLHGGRGFAQRALGNAEHVEPAHAVDLDPMGVEDPVVVLTLEELGLDLVDVPVHVVHVIDVHRRGIGTRPSELQLSLGETRTQEPRCRSSSENSEHRIMPSGHEAECDQGEELNGVVSVCEVKLSVCTHLPSHTQVFWMGEYRPTASSFPRRKASRPTPTRGTERPLHRTANRGRGEEEKALQPPSLPHTLLTCETLGGRSEHGEIVLPESLPARIPWLHERTVRDEFHAAGRYTARVSALTTEQQPPKSSGSPTSRRRPRQPWSEQ
jgi:hypothetical protein